MGKRLGGIAAGKSLSFREGVCKGKGYRFCREGLARYACPSLIARRKGPCKQQSATNSIRVLLSTQAT